MASNTITDMNDWKDRDWSKQRRKQKRSKDVDLLKPKGMVIRNKEEPYRRKKKVMPTNISIADLRPQIDVYATHHEAGGPTVVFSRDFQEEPLMKEEQIKPEVINPAVTVNETNSQSTDWEPVVPSLSSLDGVTNPEGTHQEAVIEEIARAVDPVEEVVIQAEPSASKRSRMGRVMMYAALTSVVVVGGVFAYLHLSKSGD